jgi:hypothetical protein
MIEKVFTIKIAFDEFFLFGFHPFLGDGFDVSGLGFRAIRFLTELFNDRTVNIAKREETIIVFD